MTLFIVCWLSLADPTTGICTHAISINAAAEIISHLRISETFWITKVHNR